jgi:PAS domain S-box-containing protein/putative nucleotidyltransferase with HDIG domain
MVELALASLLLAPALCLSLLRSRGLAAQARRHFSASLDLLAVLDRGGRLTRANAAWERTLGRSPKSMYGHELIELIYREDRAAARAELLAVADGSRTGVRRCDRFRAADGKYRWLEWDASPSSSRALSMVARDVTNERSARAQLATSARSLEVRVAETTRELDEARAETLRLLAIAVEYRDDTTFEHTARVGVLAAEIALELGMRAEQVSRLREAAGLHDVGKIAIPDRILLKRGNLTAAERELMESHAALGARLLSRSSSPVLQMAAVIAATHHEWWDGSGYPGGLAGERIPLVGRVVAVADVFDALTHQRPYKHAWPIAHAIARVRRGSGRQFDPSVVTAFVAVHAHVQADARSAGGEPDSVAFLAEAAHRRRQSQAARAPAGAADSVRWDLARPSGRL